MAMWWTARHGGVNERDLRNRGVIAHFRPPEVTADYVRAQFAPLYEADTPAQLEARVTAFMAGLDAKPRPPPAVLSRPADKTQDPHFGLGTHPDLVERLWRLEDDLPKPCRWTLWGRPALVHPDTGVVFAVAVGSIGLAARLPPAFRASAETARPLGKGRAYDVSAAGPDWAFLPRADAEAACQAAYAYAGEPA
jgi:hypothetical protein